MEWSELQEWFLKKQGMPFKHWDSVWQCDLCVLTLVSAAGNGRELGTRNHFGEWDDVAHVCRECHDRALLEGWDGSIYQASSYNLYT